MPMLQCATISVSSCSAMSGLRLIEASVERQIRVRRFNGKNAIQQYGISFNDDVQAIFTPVAVTVGPPLSQFWSLSGYFHVGFVLVIEPFTT